MTQKGKALSIVFIFLAVFATKSRAQVEAMASYVFTNDSVAGFDETAANAAALAEAFYGREYKVFMYRAKRDYIKQKYNLRSAPVNPRTTLFQNVISANRTSAVGGACDNEDFELAVSQINAPGAVQGWVLQSGTNANSCNPPTLSGVSLYTVFTGPTIDEKSGVLVSSYFDAATTSVPAGNAFIRLNNSAAGAKAVKMTKTFIVTPSNALFEYAYFPVIEDGAHACCSQAGFNIHITVTNTTTGASNVLACPQISIAVPGSACSFTPPPGSPVFIPCPSATGWSYHTWSPDVIDLTPYLGNQITLDVVVVDCNAGGHGGYSYFDAKCVAMDIVGNELAFPAGTPSVTLPSCGLSTATICAPPGVGPYSWTGQGVPASYIAPSYSNQCYVSGNSNDYTLTMNPPGSCQPIRRVITVTITPAPLLLITVNQPTCGATTALVTYSTAGSASVNPTLIWSTVPTSTTANGSGNVGSATFPAGTGAVTLTAKDPLGCRITTTLNIKAAAPQPTISIINVTGSPSITCITPSIDLAVQTTYTYGTLNYFWSSNSFTFTTPTINVTAPSTLITLTAIDPATGCVTSATTSVQIYTTPPTSSVSPINQSIPCGPGVVATATGIALSPTTNVTHYWYVPGLPVPYSSGGQISIISPGVGTNTHVLVNNINGCSITKTIQVVSTGGNYPTFDLTTGSTTFSLGCSTKSITDITIANANAGGGVVNYTLLPPGYTGGLTYSVGTQNVYNVTVPGTYTVIVRNTSNGCESRIDVPVIQNTFSPNASASAVTRTLSCFVPSVVLTGTSTSAPVSYTWAFQNGSNPNTQPSNTITVNTSSTGATVPSGTIVNTYTLIVLDNNNLCLSNTVVTMYQNTRPPKPEIIGAAPLSCAVGSVNLTNNSKTGILPGTFFPAGGPLIGLLWLGPTPQYKKDTASTYLAYTIGIYTMTVMDMSNGCTSQTTTVVGDNRTFPVLKADSIIALDCGAATTGGVNLPVTVVNMPPNSVSIQWLVPSPPPSVKGQSTLTLTTDGIGEYQVVVTGSNSCKSSADIKVINGELTANFTADQTTGFAPLMVNFTNNSASSNSASATKSITSVWSFGNGTVRTTTTNLGTSAVYTAPGTYTVAMFASKGSCLDTAYQVIVVDIPSKLEVPNVFTPNGDNSNDLFFIKTANLTEITAQIFDRWGNKIYELSTNKGNIAWDGNNQEGKEVPDGTYFYTIKAKGRDGQSYDTKGTVSLYR